MKIAETTAFAALVALFAASGSSAYADALPTPAMAGPLVSNPTPISFDAGPAGTIYLSGMISGFGLTQQNALPGDSSSRWDLDSFQLALQKTDGLVQFYVQAGSYDILALDEPTKPSSYFTDHSFEYVPQAYLKIAPMDNLSVEVGKLPTLIGDENTFAYQNPNVERGLLWNQTNAQTRGVQVNYTLGPVLFNLSWNDGYYSDRFDSISGLATWTIDPTDTLGFMGAGNAGRSSTSTFATPLAQNNQDIFDLMYTHTEGPWMVQPYIQYSHVPADPAIGVTNSGSTWSGAALAIYNINQNWNVATRAEYIGTSGGANLLNGPGSKAWSVTLTPTYQYKIFFARAEASYVSANDIALSSTLGVPGSGFGASGNKSDQFRLLLETGVLF